MSRFVALLIFAFTIGCFAEEDCKVRTYVKKLLMSHGLKNNNKGQKVILSLAKRLRASATWDRDPTQTEENPIGYRYTGPNSKAAWDPVFTSWCDTISPLVQAEPVIRRPLRSFCKHYFKFMNASKRAAWSLEDAEASDGSRRRLRGESFGNPTDWSVIEAYAATAGPTVHDQLIDYSNVDTNWATQAAKWKTAQGLPTWKVAQRQAPTNKSWVYPVTSTNGNRTSMSIALFGDWGTGTPQSYSLLQQAMAMLKPDIVTHIGDVYYMGDQSQSDNNIFNPVMKYVPSDVPFFNIPGNHDYYAGGQPFLNTLDAMNSQGTTPQQGPYFALETENWTLIYLDTARPTWPLVADLPPTYLDEVQLDWVFARVKDAKAANRKIIMFSHHQLFSAAESVGVYNKTQQGINENLYAQLYPVLSDLTAWFWGHEHTMELFSSPYVGLKNGRLTGASAVPVIKSQLPYEANPADFYPKSVKGPPTRLVGSPEMELASFKIPAFCGYYKPSFAVLNINGPQVAVDYYQMDWNAWSANSITAGKKAGTVEYYAPTKTGSDVF